MKSTPLATVFFLSLLPVSLAFARSNFSINDLQSGSHQQISAIDRNDDYVVSLKNGSGSNEKILGTNIVSQDAINYNNQGVVKFKSGDNYGAISDYNRALAIDPKYGESYVNRGIAKFKLGNIAAAVSDYNRAIAINTQDAEAYYNRGIAEFELGDDRAAILDFDRAITIKPDDAEVYGNRGAVKSSLGDKKGAIADLTQAAKLFREQGQFDDAQKMLDMVRQLNKI